MNGEKRNKNMGMAATAMTEGYDYSVVRRMNGRAGVATPNGGKGIAFEIMYGDKMNGANAFKSEKCLTKLTKSSTATQADLVTMKGNKVVERIQCKDTPSISGTRKTLDQVRSGKYRATQLVGTSESAAAFNEKASASGVTKRMMDSGISTKDTTRISNKYNQMGSMTGMENIIKSSAKVGGVMSGGIAAVESLVNGDSFLEAAGNVTSNTLMGAGKAAVSTAAFELSTVALVSLPVPIPAKAALAATSSILAGTVAGEVLDSVCEDIGDGVEKIVGDVSDAVFDIASGVTDALETFFYLLF